MRSQPGRAASTLERDDAQPTRRRLGRVSGAALLALLAPLACGNDDASSASGPRESDGAQPSDDARQEPSPQERERAEVALGGPARNDVVALAVSELLATYCSDCHANGQNGAGFAGGFDVSELIARGLIVPGSSAASPLLEKVFHGVTSPERTPSPSVGDIALVSAFIDRLRAEPPPSCAPLAFLSLDEAYGAMLADLAMQPAAAQPFVRYLGVSYASNAGLCGAALDEQRHAIFKLVNALSTEREIHRPVPVDPEQRLFRIDVRDYGWDRALDLDDDGSFDVADGWSALVAVAGAFAPELSGPEASALSSATGTGVPFLPANAFVSAAGLSDVYYALVGVSANLGDAQLEHGIDLGVTRDEGSERRAAFVRDRFESVMVTRAPQPGPPPMDYWVLDAQDANRGESIWDAPLEIGSGDWSKSIFRLPNGMMAFSANAGSVTRLGQLPRGCIGDCAQPAKDIAIGCHGCHEGGLLPIEDAMREVVAGPDVYLDAQTLDRVDALFPGTEAIAELISEDNARYLAALDAIGIPREASDPISRVYLQFANDPVGLARAAAELGVPTATLRERLDQLPPAFAAY
ncbi:MAG TPA: hypothetical protein VMG12_38330, partial [Polyangiaceae bacterium]|nr:hypothetical protein [Polyangiaceae bacterium]